MIKDPISACFQVKEDSYFIILTCALSHSFPSGTVVFNSDERSKVISFQATPSLNKHESFAITLTAVHSNVSGGARLR